MVEPFKMSSAKRIARATHRTFSKSFSDNRRVSGSPPFGYRRDLEEPGGYRTEPTEYRIVEEIFSRAISESLYSIAIDLEQRGIPAPRGGRRWYLSTVRAIVGNLFYAGFHTRKTTYNPTEAAWQLIKPEDREISGNRGLWDKPITLDEWKRIQDKIAANWIPSVEHRGLLSGILRCSAGFAMSRHGVAYGCQCRRRGATHSGMSVKRATINRSAKSFVEYVITQLPDHSEIPRLVEEARTTGISAYWENGPFERQQLLIKSVVREIKYKGHVPEVEFHLHEWLRPYVNQSIRFSATARS